ncbi:MAG: hypothetical protein AAB483_00670 [Patescibacteria group bacterium]
MREAPPKINQRPPISKEEMDRHLQQYREHRVELIFAAMRSRDKLTESHRDFYVGCALMTSDPSRAEDPYPIYLGGNHTPEPAERKGWQKPCAERRTVKAALDQHTGLIIAFVTVSEKTSTGDEEGKHDALHPCKECRKMFRELLAKNLLRPDSIVCNVNDKDVDTGGELKIEERTVQQLLDLYPDDPQ